MNVNVKAMYGSRLVLSSLRQLVYAFLIRANMLDCFVQTTASSRHYFSAYTTASESKLIHGGGISGAYKV